MLSSVKGKFKDLLLYICRQGQRFHSKLLCKILHHYSVKLIILVGVFVGGFRNVKFFADFPYELVPLH